MLTAVVMGVGCVCAGCWAGLCLRQRAAHLRAWQRALANMLAACAYARSNSAQVLRAGAAEIETLLPIARAVELEGADAAVLFERMEKSGFLRQEEQQALLAVMRALAGGGREEQAAALRFAMERFASFCERSEKKRDADAQMYMTLGLLGGLCMFLILC